MKLFPVLFEGCMVSAACYCLSASRHHAYISAYQVVSPDPLWVYF